MSESATDPSATRLPAIPANLVAWALVVLLGGAGGGSVLTMISGGRQAPAAVAPAPAPAPDTSAVRAAVSEAINPLVSAIAVLGAKLDSANDDRTALRAEVKELRTELGAQREALNARTADRYPRSEAISELDGLKERLRRIEAAGR